MDASRAAEKYKNNAGRAADEYGRGIDATKGNPMQKAAAAKDKYAARVNEAIAEDRFAKGCNKVSEADWKEAARTKGKRNYKAGVEAGANKYAAYATKAAPIIESVQAMVKAMPSTTKQERIDRMVKNAEEMSRLKGI